MMEMTKAFGEMLEQGVRPRRTIVFGSWDGEEVTLTGSTEWGEHFAHELEDKAVAYLETAAAEEGAQLSESGLVYRTLKPGDGPSPSATDTVNVHYHGTFPDGKVFDSSRDRGEPIEFPLKGVIPCWTEGVQKMKVGETARLVCPSDIAYGDAGRPGIPGGSTLVFEVELLGIKG